MNCIKTTIIAIITLLLMTGAQVMGQTTTPTVTADGGTPIDFTNATNTTNWIADPNNNLSAATDLTVTGQWTANQMACLRASIKNNTATDGTATNETLETVNMTAATLTGDFTTGGMVHLFSYCSKLNTATLPTAGSTERVSLSSTFRGCSALTSVTIPDGFTNISTFSYAFLECSLLETVTLPETGSMGNVNFFSAFYNCPQLHTITNLEKFTTVTNYNSTFQNCANLRQIYLGAVITETFTNTANTFNGTNCPIHLPYGSIIPDAWADYEDNITIGLPTFPAVYLGTDTTGTPIDFTLANATTVFHNLSTATALTITGTWNATQLAGLRAAIKNNTGTGTSAKNFTLTAIDMSQATLTGSFNSTSTGLTYLFRYCTALESVALPTAGSASSVSFNNAFDSCTKLHTITNLDKFTTVSDYTYAFRGCTALRRIDLGTVVEADTDKVAGVFDDILGGCHIHLPEGSAIPTAWKAYEVLHYFYIGDNEQPENTPDLPKVTVTGGTYDGQTLDFTLAQATDGWVAKYELKGAAPATALTLTGTWTAIQLAGLRASIKGSVETDATTNTTLTAVDMSAAKLTGNFDPINSGLSHLFSGCTALKTVTLPTVGSAEWVSFYYTFSDCTSLTAVTIPDGFTKITNLCGAFQGCSALETVTLPAAGSTGWVNFDYTFYNCTNLETITNLERFTIVIRYERTFYRCTSLTKIYLGAAVGSDGTFDNMTPRCQIYLPPGSVIPTEWAAYEDNITILLPPTVTADGGTPIDFTPAANTQAWLDATAATNLSTATTLTLTGAWNATQLIGLRAAINKRLELDSRYPNTALTTVDMSGVTLIGTFGNEDGFYQLFYFCTNLTTVHLPAGTTDNEVSFNSLFWACGKLHTVTGLKGFTRVTSFESTFRVCSQMESITLPPGTNYQGGISFYCTFIACKKLDTVTNLEKFTCGNNFGSIFQGTAMKNVTLPDGTTHQGPVYFDSAFRSCASLETVTNLDKFHYIGSLLGTFYECTQLTTITLSPTPVARENYDITYFSDTFYGCTKLEAVNNFEQHVGEIYFSGTFQNCVELVSITLPMPNLTRADGVSFSRTFKGCTKLQTIGNLEHYVKVNKFSETFSGCIALTELTLPIPTQTPRDGVDFNQTFLNCAQLATINNLEHYTQVSDFTSTFSGCTALSELTLGVKTIERQPNRTGTFDALTNPITVYLPAGSVLPLGWEAYSAESANPRHEFVIDPPTVTTNTGKKIIFYKADDTMTLFAPELNTDATITALTLTGTWDAAQMAGLRASMKGDITYTSGSNENLLTVDMSPATLSVGFNTAGKGMSFLFYNCHALQSVTLPAGGSSELVSFNRTFLDCTKLTTIEHLDKFTNVSSFDHAFNTCSALQRITLSPTANSNSVIFHNAFARCTNLTTIENLDAFTKVSNFYGTFYNCPSLTSIRLGTSLSVVGNKTGIFLSLNPNCLIYLKDDAKASDYPALNYINTATGTALNPFTLTDGHPYHCPTAFSMGGYDITYNRTWPLATRDAETGRATGWTTLTVPFNGVLQVAGDSGFIFPRFFTAGDDTRGRYWLKRFAGTTEGSDGETTIVNFAYEAPDRNGIAYTIRANTPYIIALPGKGFPEEYDLTGKSIRVIGDGVTVPATPTVITDAEIQDPAIADPAFQYLGNYAPVDETGIYRLARNTDDATQEAFVRVEEEHNAPALSPSAPTLPKCRDREDPPEPAAS